MAINLPNPDRRSHHGRVSPPDNGLNSIYQRLCRLVLGTPPLNECPLSYALEYALTCQMIQFVNAQNLKHYSVFGSKGLEVLTYAPIRAFQKGPHKGF